ncbi:MAG: EamA-like transporter family protein [Actinobacteria bacterium]|nr:EamA-like transporter family protein [Actinomycetota bacterium]
MNDVALRSRVVPVAMATTFTAFMLVSLQIRGIGELVERGASPIAVAGTTQLLQGLVTALLILSLPALRAGVARAASGVRSGAVPVWTLAGGLAGALQIAVMGLVSPVIGVAALTVLLVSGQTANGLVVDRTGLTPGGKRAITPARVGGAMLAVVAVGLVWWGSESSASGGAAWWAVVLAVVAGAGAAVQAALNGRVAQVAGQPVVAAEVNFLGGATVMWLLVGAFALLGSRQSPLPDVGSAWLYGSTIFGLLLIVNSAWAVKHLGVLLLSLVGVVGQISGAILVDFFLPLPGSAFAWTLVLSLAVSVVAVAVAAFARRSAALVRS